MLILKTASMFRLIFKRNAEHRRSNPYFLIGSVICSPKHCLLCLKKTGKPRLLQQHSVVALKGLEDVVVTAQGSQPIDRRISMAAAALPADVERLGGVRGSVGLQPCENVDIVIRYATSATPSGWT